MKCKRMAIETKMNTAVFSLFSKIFCRFIAPLPKQVKGEARIKNRDHRGLDNWQSKIESRCLACKMSQTGGGQNRCLHPLGHCWPGVAADLGQLLLAVGGQGLWSNLLRARLLLLVYGGHLVGA